MHVRVYVVSASVGDSVAPPKPEETARREWPGELLPPTAGVGSVRPTLLLPCPGGDAAGGRETAGREGDGDRGFSSALVLGIFGLLSAKMCFGQRGIQGELGK